MFVIDKGLLYVNLQFVLVKTMAQRVAGIEGMPAVGKYRMKIVCNLVNDPYIGLSYSS